MSHVLKVLGKVMQNAAILPVMLSLMLATSSVPLAAAERDQPGDALGRALKSKSAESTLPGTRPATNGNPCAAYGAGFARLEGSSTCVRVGGNVQVDIGGQR